MSVKYSGKKKKVGKIFISILMFRVLHITTYYIDSKYWGDNQVKCEVKSLWYT